MTQQSNTGSFIPTSFTWDIALLKDIDVTKPEFKELLVRLYQNLNRMALTLNAKVAGYYDTNEYASGKQFFPLPTNMSGTPSWRPSFATTIDFGALPNAATKSVPHGLTFTSTVRFINIYGAATDGTIPEGLPIPYSSATAVANNIELWVDGTNVNIATGVDYSSYTAYIILEYLKY